nr:cation:dicarboxylase symporter family transporter [Thermoanaerobaculia bacterium]
MKKLPLHTRVLLGGLLGAVAGILAHFLADGQPWLDALLRYAAEPLGKIFLRLLFMLVIPLIFSALVLGVAGLGDLKSLGRMGLRTLLYTVAVSTIAVVLGLTLVNVLRPGEGLPEAKRAQLIAQAAERGATVASATPPKTGIDLLIQLVPDNPIRAAAEGDMLALMFFSLFLGIGLTQVRTVAAQRFTEAVEGLYDVTMRLIDVVISAAPIGVGALLFS